MTKNLIKKIFYKCIFLFLPLLALGQDALSEARKAYAAKNFAKAYSLLETLAPEHPSDIELFLLMGQAAVKLARWEAAVSAFEKAASIEPNAAAPYIQLGFLYEKLQQFEKAKSAWEKVLSLSKTDWVKQLAKKHLENLP